MDKLIICFALNHGAIASELQQIKFSDVNLLDQTITSTTDGQHRFMFLTETDIRYLDDYLASIDDYNLDCFLLSNSDQTHSISSLKRTFKTTFNLL